MGRIPSKTALGQTYSGTHSAGRIPEEFRVNGMDDIGQLTWLDKEMFSFNYFIHKRFGNKANVVNDRYYRTNEMSELEHRFPVSVASSDEFHRKFAIGNQFAAQLQPNDILYRPTVYATVVFDELYQGQVLANNTIPNVANVPTPPRMQKSSGRYPTDVLFSRNYGFDASDVLFSSPEPLFITSVGESNSAGLGQTWITVERCWMGDGDSKAECPLLDRALIYGPSTGIKAQMSRDNGAANVGFIVDEMLIRGGNSFYEGTNAPEGVFKNPWFDYNYTQELKYAVSITNESDIIRTWLSDKPLDINRKLTLRRLLRDYEHMLLFGRKCKHVLENGKEMYMTGGVEEFIPKDREHYLKYTPSTLNWTGLAEFGKEVFEVGGSAERFLFCGYSLHAKLIAMFYNSGMIRIDPAASKEFKMDVLALNVTGGKINIVPTRTMELNGYAMRGFCLDLSVPTFEPVTNAGWDMKIDKGVQGSGIQENGLQVYKEQVITMRGLRRRYKDYQTVLDFTNVN